MLTEQNKSLVKQFDRIPCVTVREDRNQGDNLKGEEKINRLNIQTEKIQQFSRGPTALKQQDQNPPPI
ncbi:unnamed protein product [Macrosiphum euphorbiae]|uniref:Uncharacterized protein n=1 Tax=Macrosiphum euphorbiae TaxID=13131 RepID=A0AAV0WB47_9HEMI|nr:unnamed protein product [Macrosiphum euphorbiae]